MKISLATWQSVQVLFEKGYGLSIGIVDQASHEYLSGTSVASSVSRRTIDVSFVATVDSSASVSASEVAAAAQNMQASVLLNNAQTAASQANVSSTELPDASALVVKAPTIVLSAASASSESTVTVVYVIGGVGIGLLLFAAIIIITYLRRRSKRVQEAQKLKAEAINIKLGTVGTREERASTMTVFDSIGAISMADEQQPECQSWSDDFISSIQANPVRQLDQNEHERPYASTSTDLRRTDPEIYKKIDLSSAETDECAWPKEAEPVVVASSPPAQKATASLAASLLKAARRNRAAREGALTRRGSAVAITMDKTA